MRRIRNRKAGPRGLCQDVSRVDLVAQRYRRTPVSLARRKRKSRMSIMYRYSVARIHFAFWVFLTEKDGRDSNVFSGHGGELVWHDWHHWIKGPEK